MVAAIVDQGGTSSIFRNPSKGISNPSKLNASEGEQKLRKFVCKVISDSADVVQRTYDRDPIVNLIRARIKEGGIDVIDFNFDWLLLGGKPKFQRPSKGKTTPASKKLALHGFVWVSDFLGYISSPPKWNMIASRKR